MHTESRLHAADAYVQVRVSDRWGRQRLLKVPSRDITLILLANSDGLAPDTVANGDITVSLFAKLFLRLFVS